MKIANATVSDKIYFKEDDIESPSLLKEALTYHWDTASFSPLNIKKEALYNNYKIIIYLSIIIFLVISALLSLSTK